MGLELVSVAARGDGEAWVANHLSDTVTVVDLAQRMGVRYDVASGELSALRGSGLGPATGCLESDLAEALADDPRPGPAMGNGYYYLVRARNSCASPGFGPGRGVLDGLTCGP